MPLFRTPPSSPASPLCLKARTAVRQGHQARQVIPLDGLDADSSYSYQEQLDLVQDLATGPFAGEEQIRQATTALAKALERLGPEAEKLLRPPPHPGLDVEA